MKTLPHDQAERERFANELERNFSVIAAAGTGKTMAITERIAEIANERSEWLPRLAVVTFTNRAADEMQQRARQRIFKAGVPLHVLAAFNRAFFGTIHSFCTKLLAMHGHVLGLPSRLDLISDDQELWNEFVQRTDSIGESLSAENRKNLLRHVQLRDLMELARSGKLLLSLEQRDLNCPESADFTTLYNFSAQPNWTRIITLQERVREWERQFNSGVDFLPLIECTAEGRFRERWEETFCDFNEWLSYSALTVAAEVQAKYRRFRAEHGAVTFDDQIALALELTRNAEAISQIRAKDYIVILDEAQDTDPQQFLILTEITRTPHAAGCWLDNLQGPPRPGRFCMVGDFQQSIYGDRADLRQYRRVHEALINSDAGEELKFSVTFRLDQEQIEFVNKCFRDILNEEGQVGFIKLHPRPDKLPGQVVRLDISANHPDPKTPDHQKARAAAAELASWIKQTGRDKLRAWAWEQVAILCPRKNWFAPIADALRNEGIDSQIQSEADVKGDSPVYAWFTAMLTIMTQPRCGFEIAGVLREIFGISDYDLAIFSDGCGDRFQIQKETGGKSVVQKTLDLLACILAEVRDKPLFTAVQCIIESTQLRARLRVLPPEDFDNLDHELDVLLQSAATAEAEGATLEAFAELLQANFTTEREASAPRPGTIQLITPQKAKGLEWDAVIVPFFSRRIHTRDDDFPRIIVNPRTEEVIVAFSKSDVPAGAKDALEQARVQEMERLLYVALTRARHTLVLAADRQLFVKRDGNAHSDSLTTWLRSDQGRPNEPHIAQLEAEATACSKTRAHQLGSTRAQEKSQQVQHLPELELDKAKRRAAEFFRQLNPSRFIAGDGEIERTVVDVRKETETEFRARVLPSAATRYGVWWHEFAQKIPWDAEPEAWQAAFDENVVNSPGPARSKREWKLLCEYIASHRDFFAGDIFAEMPFFWRIDREKCLEGIIDFVLFRPSERKWFILDWKTNQIDSDEIDKLRAYYRPQIAAYRKAVSEMTRMKVEAAIYSTPTAKLVIYEQDELVREWARLKTLPSDQFTQVLSSDYAERPAQMEFSALSDHTRRG